MRASDSRTSQTLSTFVWNHKSANGGPHVERNHSGVVKQNRNQAETSQTSLIPSRREEVLKPCKQDLHANIHQVQLHCTLICCYTLSSFSPSIPGTLWGGFLRCPAGHGYVELFDHKTINFTLASPVLGGRIKTVLF